MKCIYGLRKKCIVYERLPKDIREKMRFGSEDWVMLHCSMCIKSTYAKAKMRKIKGCSTVNTL